MGCFHRCNNLRCRPTEDFRIWVRRRTRAIARVCKAVSSSPQQLHAALFLLACQDINHLRKIIDVLFNDAPQGKHPHRGSNKMAHVTCGKLKCDICFTLRQRQCLTRLLPRTIKRPHTKHIRPVPAEGVPVAGGKTQVLFHTLAQHQFVGIVVTEC